jgi:hypothetical protein
MKKGRGLEVNTVKVQVIVNNAGSGEVKHSGKNTNVVVAGIWQQSFMCKFLQNVA